MSRILYSSHLNVLAIFFILSLLLHLGVLLTLAVTWVPISVQEKTPGYEVPAYFYQDRATSQSGSSGALSSSVKKAEINPSREDLYKKETTNALPSSETLPASQAVPTNEEPIHLIGDKHTPPKPLAKIIGKALTKKLVYPKIAVDFKVKGTVYVGFSLFPDGTLTNIKVVQSSRADVLDMAALKAVQSITPLQNVAAYVHKPRYLVIGIIFR